jgi:glycosyltransferase involved in cell wall biosynthesis
MVLSSQLAADPLLGMSERVTIIIPCYNAERWIGQSIESALRQTWHDKEVIVINDGSSDGSPAVAKSYQNRGVRVLDQTNRGAAAARNTGLKEARGSFVQFLDADDLLAPDKIERQMRLLAGGSGRRIASGEWARFQSDPNEGVFAPHSNWRDLGGVEFLQSNYEEIDMMHPGAWLAPRALLDRAGPWNESLSLNDDGEYFARVVLAAESIVFCAGARSYYRSNLSGSLSGRTDQRALESLYRSTELILQHLLASDISPRTRSAAAYAWKWISFELYPGAPELSRRAECHSHDLGGSSRPFPAGGRFQLASKFLGWRLAKRWVLRS